MDTLFGISLILYMLKLSAGKGLFSKMQQKETATLSQDFDVGEIQLEIQGQRKVTEYTSGFTCQTRVLTEVCRAGQSSLDQFC